MNDIQTSLISIPQERVGATVYRRYSRMKDSAYPRMKPISPSIKRSAANLLTITGLLAAPRVSSLILNGGINNVRRGFVSLNSNRCRFVVPSSLSSSSSSLGRGSLFPRDILYVVPLSRGDTVLSRIVMPPTRRSTRRSTRMMGTSIPSEDAEEVAKKTKKRGRSKKEASTRDEESFSSEGEGDGPDRIANKKRDRPVKDKKESPLKIKGKRSVKSSEVEPVKRKTSKKKVKAKKSSVSSSSEEESTTESSAKKTPAEKSSPKAKKKKAPSHQVITKRDALPKLWDAAKCDETEGSYTFKIISWNVAGLRAVLKKHPTALPDLVRTQNYPDLICLQETKLQEMHVDDPKLKIGGHLLDEEGYDGYYSCSTEKKGYSGTAVFIKRPADVANWQTLDMDKKDKKQATLQTFFAKSSKTATPPASKSSSTLEKYLTPDQITSRLGHDKHDREGRVLTVDYPLFSVTNLYVPNSGQNLERLAYRTREWDADLTAFLRGKDKRGPVVAVGDLNVAHTSKDVWNDGARHLKKSAGTTEEERESFGKMLTDGGFVDSFRGLHPDALGCYSYWSQRAKNRPDNKGLRLDYFVCSERLMDGNSVGEGVSGSNKVLVRDSYILPDQVGSDHCPIVLEMEIRTD